ncbi:hypothetical protein CR513_53856, partial [Mucuna pruriens]
MAAYLSNMFGCFSEGSSESRRYICDGDVCVLKRPKENLGKRQILSNSTKLKQSLRVKCSLLSAKRPPTRTKSGFRFRRVYKTKI